MGIDSDTLYGTLNLLVLRALRDGPLHGLGVSRRLERRRTVASGWKRARCIPPSTVSNATAW